MTFSQIQQYLGRTIAISVKLLVLIAAVRFFVVDPGIVQGQSMAPSYDAGEYFLVNRLLYLVRPPQRYDVVQLYDQATDQTLIKRVVGLPGETVIIKYDGVYVQLKTGSTIKLDESYLLPDTRTLVQPGQPATWHIPEYAYYVLGDNRSLSNDSREFGSVHRRYIQGKTIHF